MTVDGIQDFHGKCEWEVELNGGDGGGGGDSGSLYGMEVFDAIYLFNINWGQKCA